MNLVPAVVEELRDRKAHLAPLVHALRCLHLLTSRVRLRWHELDATYPSVTSRLCRIGNSAGNRTMFLPFDFIIQKDEPLYLVISWYALTIVFFLCGVCSFPTLPILTVFHAAFCRVLSSSLCNPKKCIEQINAESAHLERRLAVDLCQELHS